MPLLSRMQLLFLHRRSWSSINISKPCLLITRNYFILSSSFEMPSPHCLLIGNPQNIWVQKRSNLQARQKVTSKDKFRWQHFMNYANKWSFLQDHGYKGNFFGIHTKLRKQVNTRSQHNLSETKIFRSQIKRNIPISDKHYICLHFLLSCILFEAQKHSHSSYMWLANWAWRFPAQPRINTLLVKFM